MFCVLEARNSEWVMPIGTTNLGYAVNILARNWSGLGCPVRVDLNNWNDYEVEYHHGTPQ